MTTKHAMHCMSQLHAVYHCLISLNRSGLVHTPARLLCSCVDLHLSAYYHAAFTSLSWPIYSSSDEFSSLLLCCFAASGSSSSSSSSSSDDDSSDDSSDSPDSSELLSSYNTHCQAHKPSPAAQSRSMYNLMFEHGMSLPAWVIKGNLC